MPDLQFIPPTKRKKMTRTRAAKIKLLRNAICFICRTQIRDGQEWFVEHPDPVAQGGSDDDADLWPAHTACKPKKDAVDAKSKARRDRLLTASYAPVRASKLQSRGFDKRPKQHSATRPIQRKSEVKI